MQVKSPRERVQNFGNVAEKKFVTKLSSLSDNVCLQVNIKYKVRSVSIGFYPGFHPSLEMVYFRGSRILAF